MEQPNEMNERLAFIQTNVERAQLLKGGLSLEDCRQFLDATKVLLTFFSEETKLANKSESDAFTAIVQGVRIQQSKGTFSMEGSVLMLEALEAVEKALDSRKDPALRLKELERKTSHKKKSTK
jgi:hypothetical protein